MVHGLDLPPAPPAIFAVADSLSRTRLFIECACSWQRGCAGGTNTIDDVAASVTDGRCAALVLCGTLDRCGGASEDWGRLAKQLPADLLVFSNVVAADFGADAAYETGHVIQQLLGSMDVLWADFGGLLALFDEQETATVTIGSRKLDRNAVIIDLLQRMVRSGSASLYAYNNLDRSVRFC